MRTVLKSQVPFIVGGTGRVTRRAVFEASPGFVQIHHVPVKNKAFSGYFLDCENPCPELCFRTVTETENVLELKPVPLALPAVCVTEKTFSSGGVRCSSKLLRTAGCFSVSLDSPDFCESFVCHPLSAEVRLEVYEVGAPLVGILEDDRRLTLFSCDGDFRIFLACECSAFSYAEGRLRFRRHFRDSRQRFEDVVVRAEGGKPIYERTSCGFSSRKKVHAELAPLYFLECLYEGFEEEAREYLDDSLKNADFSVMREFFGECDRVRLDGDRFAVQKDGKLRYFFFEFNDGKISNFRD